MSYILKNSDPFFRGNMDVPVVFSDLTLHPPGIIEPFSMLKQSLEWKYMYCKYLHNSKTYKAEVWYSMVIYDADFCYDIDI